MRRRLAGTERGRQRDRGRIALTNAGRWIAWLALACFVVLSGRVAQCADMELPGTWAELKVLSDSATFPLVGGLGRTTTLLQRLTVVQTGASLMIQSTYCAADFDNGPALTTTIDPAFIRSLAPVTVEASLDPTATPTRFAQSWSTELHGVRLDDPERDPLPTSASDSRVFDQDGDGKPGLTVHARALGAITGDVYVVERLRTRLEGEVVSPDRIEGRVEGTVEQVILGATNALFLGSIVSRPDRVSAHSHFVLQRVDPAWTCQDILAHRSTLFGG
ncbi:MAG: hypothetical protein NTX23_06500 [Candidatus Bipolaricaulota bacterium]|nr:hypothetical protein [Candidatus Bipolaricaulota bacterium]